LEEAVADLTEAIRINPDFAEAYHARSLVYEEQGHPDLAAADKKKANELDPNLQTK
jgi:Tfp pilus assembly protein PilF